MPTLKERSESPSGDQSQWYVRAAGSDHPLTFQVEPQGYEWLLDAGFSDGDTLDWSVFQTLRSLGLLYTLDTHTEPTLESTPTEETLDAMPTNRRVALAVRLLGAFDIETICTHDSTMTFLRSFADCEDRYTDQILTRILTGTPFQSSVLRDYESAFETHGVPHYPDYTDYDPIALALFVRSLYDGAAIDPDDALSEGSPVWMHDGYLVVAGGELVYLPFRERLRDLPDLLARALGPGAAVSYAVLEQEFAALSAAQFVAVLNDQNEAFGGIVGSGLRSSAYNDIAFVPRRGPYEDGLVETAN